MDDFFRIPKSLCYLMVKHTSNGDKVTPEERSMKRTRMVKNRKTTEEMTGTTEGKKSEEISMMKVECLSAEEFMSIIEPSKNNTRKFSKKRQKVKRKARKLALNSAGEESAAFAKECPSGMENSEDLEDVPLNVRVTNVVNRKIVRKSRKNQESVTYHCETCSLIFERKREYTIHMVNHSTVRSHKCDVCDKAYKRKSELKSHIQLHSGIKYNCDECDFVTSSKVAVRYHVRRVHQRDFRYKCEQCHKSFMSNCELKDHRTSHLNTKSFICEFCGKAYLQKTYLGAHKRTVHGVVQRMLKKEHQCKICNKSFVSEYILQNHIGIHSRKFLCPHCGKEFANNQSLMMHNRMHTGERPYPCKVCSKSFVRSNALAVHELTHTGKRPYVCDLCGKSFTQRSTMMGHRKKHPGSHPPPPPTLLSKLETSPDPNS